MSLHGHSLNLLTTPNYIADEEEKRQTNSHLPIGWVIIL